MSDSDKSGDDQVGLKRWLWPAIIFALVVIGAAGTQHWVYYNDAARNAANYSRDAQYQIATECGVALSRPSCARQIEQTRRANQREEYDLYSQQAVALWTAILGAMAIFGIALSGIGIYLIWRTWDATREAAKNSRDTLDSYIHRERAILRLGDARFQWLQDEPTPDGFRVTVSNLGASPADVTSVSWEYLNGPCWPQDRELRHEVWPDIISTVERPTETPHLGVRKLSNDNPGWLAVKLTYRTLGKRQYETFRAYKLSYYARTDSSQSGFSAISARIAYQPANT